MTKTEYERAVVANLVMLNMNIALIVARVCDKKVGLNALEGVNNLIDQIKEMTDIDFPKGLTIQ